MTYHYAFISKVVTGQEPEKFSVVAKDLHWIEAVHEDM